MKKRLLYLIYSLLFFLPAAVMAQTANHVVISEMYGGGGNGGAVYTNDFIELYNPTSAPIDISGWSVVYASATSSATAAFTASATTQTIIPANTTIKAHGYYLIQEAAGTTVTNIPLPVTADLIGTITIGATAGKIALLNTSTVPTTTASTGSTIVDFLGFGTTANTYEGTGPTVPPSNSTSVERKASASSTAATMAAGGTEDLQGNGYDSDNNANDFFVPTVVNPQNSASTVEPVLAAATVLTANPTTLDFGTNQTVNSTSAAKSFVLSGTGLTAGGTLTVTGPYTISATSGGTYGTSLTFTAVELAASPTVYVKFTPTAVGASPGSIAITSGTGSTSVPLTGTGVAVSNPATLAVTPATLTFTSQVINTSSASQFFNFTATNLSDVVTATASGPYLVSKDGIGFSNVVTYTTTEAALGPKVYVQFTPTAVGAAAASTITIATTTATSKTVALTGTGAAVPSPPTGTATHVVISEVYGAGGNSGAVYTNDYVELYNPTSSDVVMTGWSLQYQSATGVSTYSGLCPLPDGATIKAHGYYLVQFASGGSTGVALPTADFVPLATNTTQSFNLAGASGKVALCNTTTNLAGTPASTAATPPALLVTTSIVDFVAFGVVNYGSSFTLFNPAVPATASQTMGAPVLTATTSEERKALSTSTALTMAVGGADDLKGNGYDTDTDPTDFVATATLSPQNSSSVVEPAFTPAYTATPTTLTFSQNVNTTSAGVPVTLSGLGTLPATSVGTSGAYLISKTATGGYASTLTFTATEMAATTKPVVYVQFTPTALGAANSNLYITGVGATQQIIALNGTGTAQPVPTLTTTPSTLTFSGTVGVIAPVQSYTLSGTNITQPTTVTATGPYLVSKDNVTFAASFTFAITDLNAAQTPTVYVQFKPTAVGASNGTVVQTTTGGGTVSATVTLNGTGIAPPNVAPTLDVIADQNICSVTTPASIALTGITVGPSSETATQAIKVLSVTSNNPALFASLGVAPVIGGASTLTYAIASGQTGTAIVTLTLKDNGGVLNGGVDSLKRTFNVTVNALAQVTVTSDAVNNIVDKGSVATLTATGGTTYAWTSNASITSGLTTAFITIRPTTTTTYTVVATNASGCTTTQTIAITVRNASKLETGNVLTPNGDGKNDYWVVRNIDLYPGNIVKVFDKSGKLVFTKNGYNNDWNGYYNGSPLPQGTYYYVVDLGTGLPFKGTLSVVRD